MDGTAKIILKLKISIESSFLYLSLTSTLEPQIFHRSIVVRLSELFILHVIILWLYFMYFDSNLQKKKKELSTNLMVFCKFDLFRFLALYLYFIDMSIYYCKLLVS